MNSTSWIESAKHLPVFEHLSTIANGMEHHTLSLLQAPPGSGKTTILPLFLANQPWLEKKKILVLQPRRLAAKGVASRMSELLNEPLGETVGYQIRLERCTSPRTRIEIITEGLLTRRLITDPSLDGVGLIIFDEFHERSIHADVGLSLAREAANILRDDLKILVMSATIGSLAEHKVFCDAWRFSFEAKPHPLTVRYHLPEPRQRSWEYTATAIQSALRQHSGDLLAFLPGAFEIQKCRETLETSNLDAEICPLYGELSYGEQCRALLPHPSHRRKIVLATPIAETSLTIEGVRIVIDSGLHKIARSTTLGATTLSTERISLDAADQRAGRAARTGPGVCVRLWSELDHKTLRPNREPEIARADIAQTVLELAVWGVRELSSFEWISPPPTHAVIEARNALINLHALLPDGSVTELGKTLTQLGAHPRLGAMCVTARRYGVEHIAAALLPLLEERNLRSKSMPSADIQNAVHDILRCAKTGVSESRLHELSRRWLRKIQALPGPSDRDLPALSTDDAVGLLLAHAYPERIARQREPYSLRYVMASGSGVTLREGDPLRQSEFLVVADMHGRTNEGRVLQAASLNVALFRSHLRHLITHSLHSVFDDARGVLISSTQERVGTIVLSETPTGLDTPEDRKRALAIFLGTEGGFPRLRFPATFDDLQSRCMWARENAQCEKLPDLSYAALRSTIHEWLTPFLPEDGRLSSVSTQRIGDALANLLPWALRQRLDAIAPESITLQNGKIRRVSYSVTEGPIVEAVIQELFGVSETPTIGCHKIPATVHLLSPARRPMQVTKDLASFWKNGYPAVRKELRGRYPKHKWPENPSHNE